MGLADWLRKTFGGRQPSREMVQFPDAEAGRPHVVTNVPALSEPILLFMESPGYATGLTFVPSWRVVYVQSFAEFSTALPKRKYAMLIAASPADDSGAAGRAIRAFREANPDALTVYHGTDYRLAVSGPHALSCGADVLMVGGVLDRNLIFCLGTALLLKSRHGIEPSLEFYTLLLESTCADSAFWWFQDKAMPVSEIE